MVIPILPEAVLLGRYAIYAFYPISRLNEGFNVVYKKILSL